MLILKKSSKSVSSLIAVTALAAAMLSGCSAQDPDTAENNNDKGNSSSPALPTLEQDESLHARLPQSIQDKGEIVSVNAGAFPPYTIIESDDSKATGAADDLQVALGQILGVKFKEETVAGIASQLSGIASGRYDMSISPTGDFPDRQESNDFIDYVQEFVVFAVQKGNPTGLDGIDTICGLRIATTAGSSTEPIVEDQSDKCVEEGKEPATMQSYKDAPAGILAVQSGRADAFFASRAPMTFYIEQAGGKLELAGTDSDNGYKDLFQGAIVPKDSELGPVILDALKILFENGTYETIMKKWNLEANMLDEPGMNLATS